MHPPTDHRRRDFLATLAGLPVLGTASATRTGLLATAADDFLFSPGLVYLQTGSLGPTPRPVIDRTLAAWRELELNPGCTATAPSKPPWRTRERALPHSSARRRTRSSSPAARRKA